MQCFFPDRYLNSILDGFGGIAMLGFRLFPMSVTYWKVTLYKSFTLIQTIKTKQRKRQNKEKYLEIGHFGKLYIFLKTRIYDEYLYGWISYPWYMI